MSNILEHIPIEEVQALLYKVVHKNKFYVLLTWDTIEDAVQDCTCFVLRLDYDPSKCKPSTFVYLAYKWCRGHLRKKQKKIFDQHSLAKQNYVDPEPTEDIHGLLNKFLTCKEIAIIYAVYGVGRRKRYNYAVVGRAYGVSRQRIEQIVTGALTKVRKGMK